MGSRVHVTGFPAANFQLATSFRSGLRVRHGTDRRTDGHTDGQRDKQRPSIHYPHPMGHNNFSVQAYGSENVGQTNAIAILSE